MTSSFTSVLLPLTILSGVAITTSCGGDSTPEGSKATSERSGKKAKKGKKAKRKAKAAKKAKRKAKTAQSGRTYTKADKCADPCLYMAEHSFADVQAKVCKWCPGADYPYCELDWPSSDVPHCDEYRRLKNCVYAAHGYTFKNKRWAREFKAKSWYKPDPAYDPSSLSKVANQNIRLMGKIAKGEIEGCMNE